MTRYQEPYQQKLSLHLLPARCKSHYYYDHIRVCRGGTFRNPIGHLRRETMHSELFRAVKPHFGTALDFFSSYHRAFEK